MRRKGGTFGVATLATALAALAIGIAATEAPGAEPRASAGAAGLELRPLATLEEPTYAAHAPGKANRKLVFVTEKNGTVRILRGSKLRRRPFLDVHKRVLNSGEQGLLSIAFDPGYARNRRFYLYYTDRDGDVRVTQFRRSKHSRTKAKPRARRVIEVPHRDAGNHNGGTVAFGPDGYMYLATGDGGGACDPNENAQNPSSLLGKLLRIDPRRRRGYRIPADNPLLGAPGRDEVFALGLRNPFRFSFDARSGKIAIGDVGQSAWEEVDIVSLSGARGGNFGWDALEGNEVVGPGSACQSDSRAPVPSPRIAPVHVYPHEGDGHTGCAITGGLVVRDRRLASLYGRYLYADFCTEDLRSLDPGGGSPGERSTGLSVPQPTSFETDARGRVLVTSLAGGVYRLRERE